MNAFTLAVIAFRNAADSRAKDRAFMQLVKVCKPIIGTTLRNYAGHSSFEDIKNMINIVIFDKALTFDLSKGFEFNTYVQRDIKFIINRQLFNTESCIKVSEAAQKEAKKGIESKRAKDASIALNMASLNAQNDEGDSLIDSIKDSGILPDQEVIIKENRKAIVKALMNLSKSERKAFWLTIHEELSLREAGIKMNISHERVNQLKKKAISKMAKMQLV